MMYERLQSSKSVIRTDVIPITRYLYICVVTYEHLWQWKRIICKVIEVDGNKWTCPSVVVWYRRRRHTTHDHRRFGNHSNLTGLDQRRRGGHACVCALVVTEHSIHKNLKRVRDMDVGMLRERASHSRLRTADSWIVFHVVILFFVRKNEWNDETMIVNRITTNSVVKIISSYCVNGYRYVAF